MQASFVSKRKIEGVEGGKKNWKTIPIPSDLVYLLHSGGGNLSTQAKQSTNKPKQPTTKCLTFHGNKTHF